MRIPFSMFLERRFHTNDSKIMNFSQWQDWNQILYWICFGIGMGYIFVYNIWYMFMNAINEEYPPNKGNQAMAHAGVFIHACCGILLIFCGYLQFNEKARMYYPFLHRVSGYYYLFMCLIMMLGIVVIYCSGGSLNTPASAFWWATCMPYWIYTHADGFVSILRKDILRHRRMMFRGFCFGNSIIWTRLPVLTLMYVYQLTPSTALATGFWFGSTLAIVAAEVYIALDKHFMPDPIIYMDDGRSFYTTQSQMPGEGTAPTAVSVISITPLPDGKSAHLTLKIQDCQEMMYFFPGQHIALRADGVSGSKEYSPIVLEQYASRGEVHIWVRLIGGGVMSNVFSHYLKTAPKDMEMNPLAKKTENDGGDRIPVSTSTEGGALPGPPLSINVSSNRLRYFPGQYKHLIMIASGTGLAPLVTLINAIVNNKNDTAYISLVYITRGGEDYGLTLLDKFRSSSQFQLHTVNEHPNRVDADGIWRDHVFAENGNNSNAAATLANRTNVQLHVSGGPALVKRVYHQASLSTLYALPRPADQIVAWGYSDR